MLLETQLDGAQRMPRAHLVPQEAARTRPRTVSEDEARSFMQRKIAQRRSSRVALREQYDDTFVKECPFSPNAASDALQRLVNFTDGCVAEARARAHERHLWETAHEATDWDHFLERNKAFLEQKEAVLKLKRQNKELEELDGCTFHPDVGEAKRSRVPDVFCSLYREGLERRELREQMQADHEAWKATLEKEECSFHPQIEPLQQDPAMSSCRENTGKSSKARSYAQLHASQSFFANGASDKDDSDTECKISAGPLSGAAEFDKVAKSIERLNRVLAASPLVSGRRNPSR